MRRFALWASLCAAPAVAACGGDDRTCGEGTFEYEGSCVPFDPGDTTAPVTTADPPGGPAREVTFVTLRTDEPAVIYYTTDGSDPGPDGPYGYSPTVIPMVSDGTTIRFYAVDPAGNQEALRSAVYTVDRDGTAEVDTLDAQASGTDNVVSWTATGADVAGVVVARVIGPLDAQPEDGVFYDVGDSLPGGHTVLAAGAETTSATEADMLPGVAVYAAWTHDSLGNYSRPILTRVIRALPAQQASLTANIAAGAVTFSSIAANMALSATVAHDADASTATLSLQVQNQAARTIFNPKLRIDSLSSGAIDADGDLDGVDYVALGAAIGPGQSLDYDLPITGVAADAMVEVDVSIVDSNSIIGAYWTSSEAAGAMMDPQAGTQAGSLAVARDARGFNGNINLHGGAISLDGQRAYFGARNTPWLSVVDLATQQPVAGRRLTHSNVKAHLFALRGDLRRNLVYALLVDGAHAYKWQGGYTPLAVYLVKLDAGSLDELGRVRLALIPAAEGERDNRRGRHFALSADGRWAAIPIGTRDTNAGDSPASLHLVDLATMTEVDTDDATEGVQPINLDQVINPGAVAFSADAGQVLIGTNGTSMGSDMAVLDTRTFAVTPLAVGADRVTGMARGGDGTIYVAGQFDTNGVYAYTPGTGFIEAIAGTPDGHAITLAPDGVHLIVQSSGSSSNVNVIDKGTGATVTSFGAGDSMYGHWLGVTPF